MNVPRTYIVRLKKGLLLEYIVGNVQRVTCDEKTKGYVVQS